MNEPIFHVGENFIFKEDSPDGLYGAFFEDEGDTGYFYAVDNSKPDHPILDAVHIYNAANVIDRNQSSKISIIWSEDGLKSALLINGYPHAAFNFPNFPVQPQSNWRTSDHSWSDDAVAWLYPSDPKPLI